MSVSLYAAPMHGQRKLSTEGYRTRDGHLIEWFGKLLNGRGAIEVLSRPEPRVLPRGYDNSRIAPNTVPIDTSIRVLPNPRHPKAWWARSATHYPYARMLPGVPCITWNPFFLAAAPSSMVRDRETAIDLLDDWTLHHAFAPISDATERAYRLSFERASAVFANSEGTLALAHKFGRTDAHLIPNGCDPTTFDTRSLAAGPVTVGYIGKIGKRLDLDLILRTARDRPDWAFVFAGPILDREYRAPLKSEPNISLLGDVHYGDIPRVLQTFDVGWVPHSVGDGEVGGDAIKIYEYHAAGLPVASTPIIGAGRRGISDVFVAHAAAMTDLLSGIVGERARVPRIDSSMPDENTWEFKARDILASMGIHV